MFNLVFWVKGEKIYFPKAFGLLCGSDGSVSFCYFDDDEKVHTVTYYSHEYDSFCSY